MTHRVRYAFAGDGALWLHAQGCQFVFRDEIHRHGTAAGPRTAVAGELRAPLAGRVVRAPFQPGDPVGQGDTLVVIESMKMEHALSAPFAGELAELNASVGDQVVAGRVLARVLPRGPGVGPRPQPPHPHPRPGLIARQSRKPPCARARLRRGAPVSSVRKP
ncbi:MAG: acetyl-CoA carboxylase biotin carboxyl carrier protein subunit [Burkholderiaceae bacterium]|nr:acetyl-CoA carboxylase biotin carboxyl carrier protein subunit [Burkholderiaceae bacterium]